MTTIAIAIPAYAHEDGAGDGGVPAAFETTVTSRRPYAAASSDRVRGDDLASRPRRDPADLLDVIPGMLTIQHAGGGKANQYFVRGFDADHGTDVSLSVDRVPVNMVSHAHGQGYADLHFVIPELVEAVEVEKGSYSADKGDFATAGAVNLVTRSHVHRSQATLQAGNFNTYRALGIVAPELGDTVRGYFAGEVAASSGPFINPERLRRINLLARSTVVLAPRTEVTLQLQSYVGAWRASGQLPLRAVESGALDRFGFIDPSDGGNSHRHSALAKLVHRGERDDSFEMSAYALHYRLALFSNFTFFANDPVNGDQIEQDDERITAGFDARYRRSWSLLGRPVSSGFGAQLRNDSTETALWSTQLRERLTSRIDAAVAQSSAGLWLDHDLEVTRWMRAVIGLRADLFDLHVEAADAAHSGSTFALQLSPKASLVLSPHPLLDVFVNFGRGFHSNDARAVVQGGTPVAPAMTYELGSRARPLPSLDVAAAVWAIDLASETVWVGDEGTTEARGASRRRGFEVEARYRVLRWLRADADVTYSHSRFVTGESVPLAPVWTYGGGLSALHPSGGFATLRLTGFSARPANEDGSLIAEGVLLADAEVGYEHQRFRVAVAAKNLLNQPWREAQFANASRLSDEPTVVEDLHFTPGYPLSVLLSVTAYF